MPLPPPSRLAGLQRMFGMILFSIRVHWQTLVEALRRDGFAAFSHISEIRDAAQSKVFILTSTGFIAYEDTTIVPSLVKSAKGVILELGPGPGNQLHRFDRSAVDYIYGIEPNAGFKEGIEAKVSACGLKDKYALVIADVEDSDALAKEGFAEGSLDTVLCIQVLCAVKDPDAVMRTVYRLLKPGGKFIFWEHGKSRNTLTSVTQSILNPSWHTFVGCHLTRNILDCVLDNGEWEKPVETREPEDPIGLLPRINGVLVKKN